MDNAQPKTWNERRYYIRCVWLVPVFLLLPYLFINTLPAGFAILSAIILFGFCLAIPAYILLCGILYLSTKSADIRVARITVLAAPLIMNLLSPLSETTAKYWGKGEWHFHFDVGTIMDFSPFTLAVGYLFVIPILLLAWWKKRRSMKIT